ncbi:uncharacterized iron-regulated protein [Saprospira grandis DSM 2844]|uniref:Uncharacterized iron-regulated protein n=1 Tax=Saprospira grandis DSM 2844 TaxID=694433 RepID=J0P493_9BACT|nr:ChaN family lipoprotein [Saprospira grandis]EJF54659.1 uncharacterized iron-regulated protein [Saprospira grandis DSM 2844]
MKTFWSLLLLLSLTVGQTMAQEKEAYQLYDSKGKKLKYKKMLKKLSNLDMVFFGELHNNTISHWLQLELSRDLYAQRGEELVMGAEMFEADNQVIINEYFFGYISSSNFEKEMRLWPNYRTDYKPLVEFARENGLRFACTNVPRRYASMVSRQGLDQLDNLPEYSKVFFAPLPIETNIELGCYQKMLDMAGGDESFPHAQMLKDATMAHFTLSNWNEGELFLHFNGSFHSDFHEGIVYYIKEEKPEIKLAVITTVEQEDISKLDREHYKKADYILVVPSRMTKTY